MAKKFLGIQKSLAMFPGQGPPTWNILIVPHVSISGLTSYLSILGTSVAYKRVLKGISVISLEDKRGNMSTISALPTSSEPALRAPSL